MNLSVIESYDPIRYRKTQKHPFYRVSQQRVPYVNHNNSETSTLLEKIRYFSKPEKCANVLDQFRIEQDECYKNKGVCRKSLFLNILHVFLHTFPSQDIFRCSMNKKCVFQIEIKITNKILLKQCLLSILNQFFLPHGGNYMQSYTIRELYRHIETHFERNAALFL